MIVTCKKCKKDFTWIRYCAEDDIPPDICDKCRRHLDEVYRLSKDVNASLYTTFNPETAENIALALHHLHFTYIKEIMKGG